MTRHCTHILTCSCAEYLFGFDLATVQEVLAEQTMTRVPGAPDHFLGLINLRGDVVPAISLRLALSSQSDVSASTSHRHVILDLGGPIVSIVVDNVGDVVEALSESDYGDLAGLQSPLKELVASIYSTENQTVLRLSPAALLGGLKS